MRKVRGLHPEDAVQAALDRFGRADSAVRLDSFELNRLYRNIVAWKFSDLLAGEFGLRAKDAANQKRITNEEAFLLYLMAAYYAEIERYAVEQFVSVTGASEKAIRDRLMQPTVTTPMSMDDALSVDVAYRARQIQKLAQADRQQRNTPNVTQTRYSRLPCCMGKNMK